MTTNSPNPDVQERKQKRIDYSKLATEIVHNLVSTDSFDEEVTEKLIQWVLNRLNKEFPTPPAKFLRPVELPGIADNDQENFFGCSYEFCAGWKHCLEEVEQALRQQGYEVKS